MALGNEENKRFRPITDWCSHYALFFDDNGAYVGSKKIKYSELTLNFKDRTFNFIPSQSTHFKIKGIFVTKKYYLYNINEPMPFVLTKNYKPLINSEVYKVILDSDLVKKLNPKKLNILDLIGGWKGLVILLIVGGIVYYLFQGGNPAEVVK